MALSTEDTEIRDCELESTVDRVTLALPLSVATFETRAESEELVGEKG